MSISSENVKYQKTLVSNFDTLLTVLPDRLILPFWESNVTKIACSKSLFIRAAKTVIVILNLFLREHCLSYNPELSAPPKVILVNRIRTLKRIQ